MSDATLIVGGMLCPQTGVTQYHADKGREIKGLVVCNSCDLEPLDLLNGLALGCYKPYPEVCLVYNKMAK